MLNTNKIKFYTVKQESGDNAECYSIGMYNLRGLLLSATNEEAKQYIPYLDGIEKEIPDCIPIEILAGLLEVPNTRVKNAVGSVEFSPLYVTVGDRLFTFVSENSKTSALRTIDNLKKSFLAIK